MFIALKLCISICTRLIFGRLPCSREGLGRNKEAGQIVSEWYSLNAVGKSPLALVFSYDIIYKCIFRL